MSVEMLSSRYLLHLFIFLTGQYSSFPKFSVHHLSFVVIHFVLITFISKSNPFVDNFKMFQHFPSTFTRIRDESSTVSSVWSGGPSGVCYSDGDCWCNQTRRALRCGSGSISASFFTGGQWCCSKRNDWFQCENCPNLLAPRAAVRSVQPLSGPAESSHGASDVMLRASPVELIIGGIDLEDPVDRPESESVVEPAESAEEPV